MYAKLLFGLSFTYGQKVLLNGKGISSECSRGEDGLGIKNHGFTHVKVPLAPETSLHVVLVCVGNSGT